MTVSSTSSRTLRNGGITSIRIAENMNAPLPLLSISPNQGEGVSTRIAFLIAGLVMSTWAPLVPLAKDRTGLEDGGLGLLLLGLGGGSIAAMPFAGYLTARYGCRPVIVCASPWPAFAISKAVINVSKRMP
jgi:MFS family permease